MHPGSLPLQEVLLPLAGTPLPLPPVLLPLLRGLSLPDPLLLTVN